MGRDEAVKLVTASTVQSAAELWAQWRDRRDDGPTMIGDGITVSIAVRDTSDDTLYRCSVWANDRSVYCVQARRLGRIEARNLEGRKRCGPPG